ncbi:MAG: hypothetical protein LUH20_10270 [Lachnospiraceae bacterium]|nr:hypothetical protein [Lachnospiraceae bacterium]
MLWYGYLNYNNGCVRIPSKKLEQEFDRIIRTEPKYSYMRDLERESTSV